jgi:DNA-directed RNA polymerase specialized sigma24 family protein
MLDNDTFHDLIRRAQQGEEAASQALVSECEPFIRRCARAQLISLRSRLSLDSDDVCQMVLARFFLVLARGDFEFAEAQDMFKLLNVMTHNLMLDELRKSRRQSRDRRREQDRMIGDLDVLDLVADPAGTPSKIVAGHEIIGEIRRRMSGDELYLLEQRAVGRGWADLAAEQGCQPDALRKKLDRAVQRVFGELDIIRSSLAGTETPRKEAPPES